MGAKIPHFQIFQEYNEKNSAGLETVGDLSTIVLEDEMADLLSTREEEILFGLISEYIESQAPVGSRVLAERSTEGLSSATIRAHLADLEDRGYLRKPHPSAGREPTDTAFRYFAQKILILFRPGDTPDWQEVERLAEGGSLSGVVRNAVGLLAKNTRSLGFALKPVLDVISLRLCEFVRIAPDRVLLVLVSQSGDVHEHILKTSEAFDTKTLRTFSNYLNDRYQGWSFEKIRAHLRDQISRTSSIRSKGVERAYSLVAPFFLTCPEVREVCYDGLQDLLGREVPGGKLRGIRFVLESLETRSRLLELLDAFAWKGRQIQVIMGTDLPVTHATDLSMVVASYETSAGCPGLVGVVGPKSMRYDTNIPLVSRMAQSMSLAGTRL